MDRDEAYALGRLIEADDPMMIVDDPELVDADAEGPIFAIVAEDSRTGQTVTFYSHADWANYPRRPGAEPC